MGEAKRRKALADMIRPRAHEQHNGIYVPRVEGDKKTNWPVCMTCHRDIDSVNVEHVSNNYVDIRAKCHGQECVIRCEFPYRITCVTDEDTWHHVQTAINEALFFDPSVTL